MKARIENAYNKLNIFNLHDDHFTSLVIEYLCIVIILSKHSRKIIIIVINFTIKLKLRNPSSTKEQYLCENQAYLMYKR